MNLTVSNISNNIRILAVAAMLLCAVGAARALPAETYATKSALASGKWVKVSVDATGIYRLTPATLRRWGFADPSKVSVYGYGAYRTGNRLSAANFYDDLPALSLIHI